VLTSSRFLDGDRDKVLRLDDGSEIVISPDLLVSNPDGTYRLTVPVRQILAPQRSLGEEPPPAYDNRDALSEHLVVPAMEEQIQTGTRLVETGRIRVHKRVETTETMVDEPLVQQGYDIERVSVNRIVDGPVEPRYEGDTIILPVLEEVLVVQKRLVLREELRLTRKQREVRDPQTHTVRREHIDVERVRS